MMYGVPVPPRAPALPPDERRAHLAEAALRVLRCRGPAVTTREIAEEAGVAEGTLFRVFASKDQLVRAALVEAFDPEPTLRRITAISLQQPLPERLVALVQVLQARFAEVFDLMEAMGYVAIPDHHAEGGAEEHARRHREIDRLITALIEPDAHRLTVTPAELARLVRMLTFAGTHRKVSEGNPLAAERIVDVLLHGTSREPRC